jgi:hypothetical protein
LRAAQLEVANIDWNEQPPTRHHLEAVANLLILFINRLFQLLYSWVQPDWPQCIASKDEPAGDAKIADSLRAAIS